MTERPLETGWLPDTPADDNILRSFALAQGSLDVEIAMAFGGRADDGDEVALADSNGPVPFYNQAVLRRPVHGVDDPVLAEVASFFEGCDRPHTLLSVWPTPDLTPLGWTLMGHPALVVRPPGPHRHENAPGVTIEDVTTSDRLAVAERVAIEGYPLEEAADAPTGTVMPPAQLGTSIATRLGNLDGEPVAVGLRHIAHGVVNLCLGATLPAARRRGVWEALVWARVDDAPDLPAVAYTSDFSRPGFLRMGFLPITRFTLWVAA